MGKLLLWAIVILAALIIMRLWTHKNAHDAARRNRAVNQPRPGAAPPESMVRCAHCGIHLPRSDALLQHGQLWCCEEHARLGHAGNGGNA